MLCPTLLYLPRYCSVPRLVAYRAADVITAFPLQTSLVTSPQEPGNGVKVINGVDVTLPGDVKLYATI